VKSSAYLARRLASAAITLVVVIVFNFFLFRILPGDPVKLILKDPRIPMEAQAQLRVVFGLDKPVWLNLDRLRAGDVGGALDTQFTAYVKNLLRGNLGISFTKREDVGKLVLDRAGNSLILVLVGESIAILLGTVLGLLGAWRRGTALDTTILVWALFSSSMPAFFLGILVLFSLAGGTLPFGGMVSVGLKPEAGLPYWIDVGRHALLPAFTMAIVYTGAYLVVTRSSVMDILCEDYVLVAKAKGLGAPRILLTHVFRNALLPMVTMIGMNLGFAVAGSIQVETVFSWPGLGRLMFDAVSKQDYPLLQGGFLLIAVFVVSTNLVVDLLYSVMDPRVRTE
jgi:peptide/nickel transport system permease protein